MENFIYKNPTKICFGRGEIQQLSREIAEEKKVLLVYGGGSIKKNGVYEQVIQALDKHTIVEFNGVEANPTYETCMKAITLCQAESIDFILAVGGGSVLDAVKFIAAGVCFEGKDPWEILEKRIIVEKALPFGSVLTLSATGSEMNCGSVITHKGLNHKRAFISPVCYPQFSILDPEVTFSLPERQVKNGVVDAFTHVMEQYLTYPADAPLQDRFAESILQTLIEVGPITIKEPQNYQARANMMWCATMALNGLIGCGVPQDWSTHMIGHQLTSLYGLDHAVTLAIILPAVMQTRRVQKREKLLQYAERVWQIDVKDPEAKIDLAIEKTRLFFESIGIATKLSDYEIEASEFPKITALLQEQGLVNLGEHMDLNIDVVDKILAVAK